MRFAMTHTLHSARTPRALATTALALVTALAALLLPASQARAADGPPTQTTADGLTSYRGEMPSPITDHFYARISDFAATVRTSLRIDPSGVPYGGTPLSAESD